jgi:hypothetical protein
MADNKQSLEQALALLRLEFLKELERAGIRFEVFEEDGLTILTVAEALDYLDNPDATIAKHRGVAPEVWLEYKEYLSTHLCPVSLHEFISNPPKAKQNHPSKPIIPDKLRWEVWERDNFTCCHCGKRTDLTIDHIVPVAKGGQTVKDNLQTLCKSCNSKKGVTDNPLHSEAEQCHEPNLG